MAEYVARRDGYRCVAPCVDGRAGWCHDQWGHIIRRWPRSLEECEGVLTLAHVKDSAEMGNRAPSNPDHLVMLCWGHHEGAGETGKGGAVWGTSHINLEKLRRYLAQFHPLHPRTPEP